MKLFRRISKIVPSFLALLILLNVVLPSLWSTYSRQNTAIAASALPEDMCIPKTSDNGTNPHVPVGDWLKVIVINRATLQISFEPANTDTCDQPANVPLSNIVAGDSTGQFKALVDDMILFDYNTQDSNYSYSNLEGAGGKEDEVYDEANINNFDPDAAPLSDPLGNRNNNISASDFANFVLKSDFVIAFENGKVNSLVECIEGEGNDGKGNFYLSDVDSDNKGLLWNCEQTDMGDKDGISIGTLYQQPENFNITHNVKGEGSSTIIEHVSGKDEGLFKWCQLIDPSTGADISEFRDGDCNKKNGYRFIEGITPEGLATQADNDKISVTIKKEGSTDSYQTFIAGANTFSSTREPGTNPEAVGSVGGDDNPTCETQLTNPMSWAICPLINGALDAMDWFFRVIIEPFLRINPITTDSDDYIYQIWASFRTLGNILLIFGLLFIVFGQAIGGGLVDAYTAKKALPRILLAAVLINLSIYVVAILVDIFNIIGVGIGQIITSPLKGSGSFDFTIGSGKTSLILAGGLIATLLIDKKLLGGLFTRGTRSLGSNLVAEGGGKEILIMALFFIIIPILVAVISVFGTLIIRRGLIIFLAIISPIAMALYTIPATEKFAKKWYDMMLKSLMVYPIIVAIFAISDVLSTIIFNSGANDAIGGSATTTLVALVVLFIPMFMIPFAFKLAGGAIATVYGTIKKSDGLLRGDKHNPHDFRRMGMHKKMEGFRTRLGTGTMEIAEDAADRGRYKTKPAKWDASYIDPDSWLGRRRAKRASRKTSKPTPPTPTPATPTPTPVTPPWGPPTPTPPTPTPATPTPTPVTPTSSDSSSDQSPSNSPQRSAVFPRRNEDGTWQGSSVGTRSTSIPRDGSATGVVGQIIRPTEGSINLGKRTTSIPKNPVQQASSFSQPEPETADGDNSEDNN